MTQQDALSSLFNNAARRPVDVNLGQVPLTPTIGRMGNYNVVVNQTPRDNRALELSRALSELPQLLGQARNISAASGARQAEEISLEELETKVKNGDVEAEGVLTWLGADKEYQEAAYKRLADANIAPTLTNISSEIDRMSHAELLKFNSPDDIKAHVNNRLVGSLDTGIMETIKGKPWMEIRHNRYMEAIVPEYVEKVNASIEGRKHEFKIKEALAALETNFLAQSTGSIPTTGTRTASDSSTEDGDGSVGERQELYTLDPETAENIWVDNFQYSLDFAAEQAGASGLNKFQIESKLMPALTAKVRMLIEDEQYSEASLALESAESGQLKINGRPINRSTEGLKFIETVESLIEQYEEEGEKIDVKKVDAYQLKEITRYNDARALPDFKTEDYEDYYRQQRADLDNSELGFNVREQLTLSAFYDKEIARLRGSERIYENFSNPEKEQKKEEFKQTYETSQRTILKAGITPERARESSGLDPAEFDSMFLLSSTNLDTGKVTFKFRPETEHILYDAALQAESSTLENYIDRPRGDLFLGSDSVSAGNAPNQTEFRQEVSETAQGFLDEALGKYFSSYAERIKAQNPPLSDEEAQKRQERSVDAELAERHYKRNLKGVSGVLDKDGKITPKKYRGSILTRMPEDDRLNPFGPDRSDEGDFELYHIDAANETIKNKHASKLLKENPLLKRLELMSGLEAEARRPARLEAVGKRLDKIYGTDVYDDELKRELELVRYSGISFGALLDGGRADGDYTTKTGLFGPLAPKADQRQVPWTIDYDKFDSFSTAAATKERIFNLGAITRYKQQGKDDDFRRIHSKLLKTSGISLEAFIQNQVKLAESIYGNLEE